MAWLLSLFKSGTTWAVMGMAAFFLIYGSVQELKLDRAEKAAAEWKLKAEAAEAELSAMKLEREKMISAMDAQQKAAQKAQAGRNAARSAVRKEVSNNEAVRDWHNSPVPPSLVRMLSSRDHGAD